MKTLKQILALLLVLQIQAMATESLKKSDPEVIALCDKNGDKKIKGKDEGLCYLDLKKKKAEEKLNKSQERLNKSQEKLNKSKEKLGKLLNNDNSRH